MQFRTQAFPFCPTDNNDVHDGTLHPFTAPLQKCSEWYWRVKKWTVVVHTTPAIFTFVDVEFSLDTVPFTTERDLICMPKLSPFGLGRRASGSGTGSGHTADWEAFLFSPWLDPQVSNTSGPPGTPGRIETDGLRHSAGGYWPQFLFRLNYDGSIGDLSTHSGGGGAPANVGTLLQFNGYTVRCYANTLSDILSVTWTPQEWWPYAPASNPLVPVFDTGTGIQINPNTVSD